ncbi:VOC family protein, partial [Staphylococcus pseudintermedius]
NQKRTLTEVLKSKGIQVGGKQNCTTGTVFQFADEENNYFEVR